jgi:hypothetical protein
MGLRESSDATYACPMQLSNPFLRAGLAFLAVVATGGWLWFEWDARLDGFGGYLDRRAGHASGILSGVEWKSMRASGDHAAAASGTDATCTSEACGTARAHMDGLWAGGASCAEGDRYRFTDSGVDITSHQAGRPSGMVRRGYRIVAAPVTLRLLRDRDGKPIERSVTKQPGDIEVFTIGRSSYVRRIFRAADSDTIRLILVEQRVGRTGPAFAIYVEGKPTSGGGPDISYRRCP